MYIYSAPAHILLDIRHIHMFIYIYTSLSLSLSLYTIFSLSLSFFLWRRHIHVRDSRHARVRPDSFTRVTWLICISVMTHWLHFTLHTWFLPVCESWARATVAASREREKERKGRGGGAQESGQEWSHYPRSRWQDSTNNSCSKQRARKKFAESNAENQVLDLKNELQQQDARCQMQFAYAVASVSRID